MDEKQNESNETSAKIQVEIYSSHIWTSWLYYFHWHCHTTVEAISNLLSRIIIGLKYYSKYTMESSSSFRLIILFWLFLLRSIFILVIFSTQSFGWFHYAMEMRFFSSLIWNLLNSLRLDYIIFQMEHMAHYFEINFVLVLKVIPTYKWHQIKSWLDPFDMRRFIEIN